MAVSDDIAAGVVALIDGLGLTGVTVVARKIPAMVEGDTPPVVCVAVTEVGEDWETADDDAGRAGRYRLTVVVLRRSGGTLTDTQDVRDWRQAIRRRLTREPGLTGVPAVDWVEALPTPQWDAGLLDDGIDYSPLAFSVKTREPR